MSKPINLKSLSGAINLDAESSSDHRVKILGMVRAKRKGVTP